MCRHFEHTHVFGDTPSITLHSPLSSRSPKQKFAGFIVRPDTQKNTNFKQILVITKNRTKITQTRILITTSNTIQTLFTVLFEKCVTLVKLSRI